MTLLSPNSSNLQPWEFHWVRSAEKKAALVEACLSQPAAATAAELVVCVARTKTWKGIAAEMVKMLEAQGEKAPKSAIDYYKKLVPLAYGQGPLGVVGAVKKVIMFFAGFFRPVPREPASCSDMRVWAVKTVALGCQTLMLALRAAGFDSCPMEGADFKRIRKILGLPWDAYVVMVISAGKRVPGAVYGPRVRFPKERFLFEA